MRADLGAMGACFLASLLFAGTLSLSESVTALVLGAIGGASAAVLARVSERRFAFSADHALVWMRALRRVPAATMRTGSALLGCLLGASPGRADRRPFRHGQQDAPGDRARRAMAVLAASLAPDAFVVMEEAHRDTVLLHGIDTRAPTAHAEWLA